MTLLLDTMASPLGTILLVTDGKALRALDFHDYEPRMLGLLRRYGATEIPTPAPGSAAAIAARLTAYFAGDLAALDAVPADSDGTAFQRTVWAALRRIPAGTTTSYGGLAQAIGRPTACRAVGLANGSNPIAIVVPCHRVVGSNGSLTGYGGGLPRKRWLIDHERRHAGMGAAA